MMKDQLQMINENKQSMIDNSKLFETQLNKFFTNLIEYISTIQIQTMKQVWCLIFPFILISCLVTL